MATVHMDPYLVQWIREWIKHQELKAQIEHLGDPEFELPPASVAWGLAASELSETLEHGQLQSMARRQIDQQLRLIEQKIAQLEQIKGVYREMRDHL